jgi:hypothetical protein
MREGSEIGIRKKPIPVLGSGTLEGSIFLDRLRCVSRVFVSKDADGTFDSAYKWNLIFFQSFLACFLHVLNSTQFHLTPLRFQCVEGCWV